jgi:hypothetical protein
MDSHIRRALFRHGLPLLGAALVLVAPRAARAETQLSFEAGGDFPSASGADDGYGLGMRFGHKYNLALIKLVPELGLRYSNFSGPSDEQAFSVLGGGRVGIDFIVEPAVFAHAGVGHLWGRETNTSLAYDVGASLDLTVLPVIDFGPHVMLAGIAGSSSKDPFSWLEVGGHVTFNFGEK